MKVAIDITSRCNLRCQHCYNSDKYFNIKTEDLSDDDVIKLVNNLADSGCDELNILGGEPFMRKNLLEVLRVSKKRGMLVSLTTNGTLIGDSMNEAIFKENLLNNLIFSLDGSDAAHNDPIRGDGVFCKLMKNMEITKKWREKYGSKISVSISYCLFNKTIDFESCNIIDICKKKKIDSLSFSPVVEAGGALRHRDYLEKTSKSLLYIDKLLCYAESCYPGLLFSIEERPVVAEYFNLKYRCRVVCPDRHVKCGVLNNCIYIKADGVVLPCGFVEFKKGFEEQKKGMFNEKETLQVQSIDDFKNVYKSKLFCDFIDNYNKYNQKINREVCVNCFFEHECQPCAYQNQNGEIFKECKEILPLLRNLIKESQEWGIEKIFSNKRLNELCYKKPCSIGDSFQIIQTGKSYYEFLREVISFEKRGLIKVNRR